MTESPPPPAPKPPAAPPPSGGGGSGEGGLRRWGIGLGLVGMAVAIAIAALSCRNEPMPPADAPVEGIPQTAVTSPPDAAPSEAPAETDSPQAAPASADTQRPARPSRNAALCPPNEDHPEILVAFERSHPLNEAQRLFAAGRRDEARALAARLLAERRDLRGLCLQRFTVGGAELVLGAPDAASLTEWTERLSGMDGVAYAEPNLVASPY